MRFEQAELPISPGPWWHRLMRWVAAPISAFHSRRNHYPQLYQLAPGITVGACWWKFRVADGWQKLDVGMQKDR
jgi:hypothetical protein